MYRLKFNNSTKLLTSYHYMCDLIKLYFFNLINYYLHLNATALVRCRLLTNSIQFAVLTTFFCGFASGLGVDLYRWSKPHISLFVRQALLWITHSVLRWCHVRMFNCNRHNLTFVLYSIVTHWFHLSTIIFYWKSFSITAVKSYYFFTV